ncbi:hypothetical protein [Streptomyces sp. NPDC091219]|uniref:hypothetical protein n=1 Tax=Streptomyces sp. NPDC091219 TaxID=3155193 RepID=UPI00344E7273
MVETALTLFSIVLQVLGLVAAAVGLFNTFKDSSNQGDRFLTRVMATELGVVRQLWLGSKRLSRRLFGRPRPTTVYGRLDAAMEINFVGTARGTVQFGPLPDHAQDPDGFRTAIEERLNRVFKLAQDMQHDLGQETRTREQEDQKTANDLQARLTALDEEAKQKTIRGLHEQVLGLFCVAAGLAVQSILDLAY